MYVLGIETSCDETSAAVVKDGRALRSCVVASSLRFHKKYGGVVPEIAFRMQLETIAQVCDEALKEARVSLKEIGLIGVTHKPGLLGSLLVGVSFAKGVSASAGIPLVGVDHLLSHIYASHLNAGTIRFPYVALIVSGGHTSLLYAKDFGRMALLGSTCDDACGEVFDKVAKMLSLGYPGGPVIEARAKQGDPGAVTFSCSKTHGAFDFSFSGVKTAVLYYINKARAASASGRLTHRQVADICASFQESVIDVLVAKSLAACAAKRVKTLVVGGGVAANGMLRQKLQQAAGKDEVRVYFPSREFCMDNAAMVAGLAYHRHKKGAQADLYLTPHSHEREVSKK